MRRWVEKTEQDMKNEARHGAQGFEYLPVRSLTVSPRPFAMLRQLFANGIRTVNPCSSYQI
jgi:hypothetical protein